MNACQATQKRTYRTAPAAWRVIQRQHPIKSRQNSAAYRFPHCHQWHITTHCRHDHPVDWPLRKLAWLEREARV